MSRLVNIDGSLGEGGGQVLRTSLALAAVTATPLRIENIRAGRKKPGLLRQHLTCVRAAAAIADAEVEGAALGSGTLTFRPRALHHGEHHFAVGSAGSAGLVLQTVLPPLLCAGGPSRLTLEGGTHNPMAPPWDFLERVYLPLLARMGPRIDARLVRHGFFPAGGGMYVVDVSPCATLRPLHLEERGDVRTQRARVLLSRLPRSIGERELAAACKRLTLRPEDTEIVEVRSPGPGNAIHVEIESERITEVFSGFGSVDVPSEAVAREPVDEARRYLAAGVPVGTHLADQILLPMALAGAGSFVTLPPTRHTTTNIEVIRSFLDVAIEIEHGEGRRVRVAVGEG